MRQLTWTQSEALRMVVVEAIRDGHESLGSEPERSRVWNENLEIFYAAHDAMVAALSGKELPGDDTEAALAESAGNDAVSALLHRT